MTPRSHRAPSKHRRAFAALAIALALVVGAFSLSGGPAPVAAIVGGTVPCVGSYNADGTVDVHCDALATPTTPPTVPPTTAPPTVPPTTAPPTTTPPATTPPATTTPPMTTPPATTPPSTSWPDASNTGVPPFTVLTAYTGPCTITTANAVIDAKTVTCDLNIQAKGVVVTRSRLQAIGDGSANNPNASFSVTDSEITCAVDTTCIGESHFTLLRVNAHGGNRIAHCYTTCSAADSWFHGIRFTGNGHASAFRLGQYTTLTHNTISCDAANTSVGGGCSADVTGYPDFEPIHHNTVTGCLLTAPAGAYYHAYGGATAGKAFSSDATNATYVVFTNNTFVRSPDADKANVAAVTDFATGRTGNVYSGNVWSSGGVAGL